MNKIFIMIPAYNEEQNIVQLLTTIEKLNLTLRKKVILIDDGSCDKTQELARGFSDRIDMEIIIHPKNMGIPKTFFDGLTAADKQADGNDVITIAEADNTGNLQLIPEMIDRLKNGSDIVVASRYIKGGRYKDFPLIRLIGSYIVNKAFKIFCGVKNINDYTIFFRAYRASIVKRALAEYKTRLITTKTFAANLEILLKFKEWAENCSEVPLVYDYSLKKGKSKMPKRGTLLECFVVIIRKLLGKL